MSGLHARHPCTDGRASDPLRTLPLRRAGWRVLRIWGHELTRKNEPRLLARLRRHGLVS